VSGGRPITSYAFHSTIAFVLPYMEEGTVADQLNLDLAWDHADASLPIDNLRLSRSSIATLRCPTPPNDRASPDSTGVVQANNGAIDYRVCTQFALASDKALETLITAGQVQRRFPAPPAEQRYFSALHTEIETTPTGSSITASDTVETQFPKLKQITDGTSQTMMWFETGGAPLFYKDGVQVNTGSGRPGATQTGETQGGESWANYDNWYVVHDRSGSSFFNYHNNEEIYSFHVGGAYFGFADGSVHFVATSIDPDVFVSLFTREGADIIRDLP
jgi:hypothetical protein